MSAVLVKKIEALLFVAARPLTVDKLSALTKVDKKEVKEVLSYLQEAYEKEKRGIMLTKSGMKWHMVTAPEAAGVVATYLKEETSGELTKPSLETLAIVAYRGPVSRAEMEQIRGVNCALIIRNLLIRGLIEEVGDKKKNIVPYYQVTVDLLKHLGLKRISDLPRYDALNKHVALETFLSEQPTQSKT